MSVVVAARPSAERFTFARQALPFAVPATLTATIVGLGGQGVVGLARLLAQALQLRYARTASVETRGIAQRRAPVKATVRAGAAITTAAAPDAMVNLVVALEAGEALRVAPLLPRGSACLLADLSLPPSIAGTRVPTAAEVAQALQARGVTVLPLQVQRWLAEQRAGDAVVSTIAYGALAALFELPPAALPGRGRDDAAFEFGHAQFEHAARAVAAANRAEADAVEPAELAAA